MIKKVNLQQGITEIQTFFNDKQYRAFVVDSPQGAVLIDTCLGDNAQEFVDIITPMNITMVVLTHHHQDHTGGLQRIVESMPQVEIAAHELEVEKMSVPITHVLKDGDLVADILQVIHIPGHTAGNIALYYVKEKILFAGDSVFGAGGYYEVLSSPPKVYSEDVAQARKNLLRLFKFPIEKAFLSHGEHLYENVHGQLSELV